MNKFDLNQLIKKVEKDRNSSNYVAIRDLSCDFRKLRRLSYFTLEKLDDEPYEKYPIEFENELSKLCDSVFEHNIPFDRILISGKLGLIINSDKHRELLKEYMNQMYQEYHRTIGYDHEIKWDNKAARTYLTNITIDDTFKDFVPVNFIITPYITLKREEDIGYGINTLKFQNSVPSHEYFGIDPVRGGYNSIVSFNKFVEILNSHGYHLFIGQNEIKDYGEYFEKLKTSSFFAPELTIDINLSSDNNIRR